MEIENNLEQINNMENNIINEQNQNNFLKNILGKTINTGIDIGLRWILPDIVENEVINIKNSLIKGGLKEGIDTAINTALSFGKSAIGIFTGKFENINQAQTAIKSGGIIDNISNVLDIALNKSKDKGLVNDNVASLIKKGKNVILDNVSKSIENSFTNQLDNIEKLNKYEKNWKEYFKDKNFDGMQKEYVKIKNMLKELLPLENTMKEARKIENLHLLIKNNGQDFNLSNEQLKLAEMLT